MSHHHNQLLIKSIQVIESYDPRKTTIDAHFNDCPVAQDKKLDGIAKKFLHQVFYGCIRYQKFLKYFVTSLLYKDTSVSNSDKTLYMVLAYLLFFRGDELGVAEMREFLFCDAGTPPAMHALLSYVFSERDLNKWVKIEWCKVYDMKYIEDEVIGKMQRWKRDPEMRKVIDDMSIKATGFLSSLEDQAKDKDREALMSKPKKVTAIEPFNLTKPKPRLIPVPDEIPRQIKAEPVPKMINATNLDAIAKERKEKLAAAKEEVNSKYGPEHEFELETAKRVAIDEHEELRKEVEALRFQECTFKPAPAKDYHPPQQIAEVRQNQASILREDALVSKKQKKEYDILKDYESELRDASEFYEWQTEMRAKDQFEEEFRTHKRKVEMEMARENAIEAHERNIEFNHIRATHQKGEMERLLAAQEAELHDKLLQNQKLVQDVIDDRHRPRDAEEAVLEDNKKRAEELRKEKEKEMEIKKREDAKEMERRKEIIREIRALERVTAMRVKTFDPAEDPRGGYMEEMSLAELRERVKILKAQQERDIEAKREVNLEKKVLKQREFTEKAENLERTRSQAKLEAKERHERLRIKQREEEIAKEKFHEQCVVEVAEKIAQKKKQKIKEEIKLKKELKEISIKNQFLLASAELVEAKAHQEQQTGLAREARVRQDESLYVQMMKNQVHRREYLEKVHQKALERENYKRMQQAVDKRLAKAKADDTALKEDIKFARSTASKLRWMEDTKVHATIGHSVNKYSGISSGKTTRIVLPASDEQWSEMRRSMSAPNV